MQRIAAEYWYINVLPFYIGNLVKCQDAKARRIQLLIKIPTSVNSQKVKIIIYESTSIYQSFKIDN